MVTGVDHAPAANLKHVEGVVAAADDVLGEPLISVVFPVKGGLEAAPWSGRLTGR